MKLNPNRYVVETPFPGHIVTILTDGGRSQFGGETLDELKARYANPLRVVDGQTLDEMFRVFEEGCKTLPATETEDEFRYALECLPPCKWRTVAGVEMFHISERIRGNLVSWHFRIGDWHGTATRDAAEDPARLSEMAGAAYRAHKAEAS